MGDFDVVKVVLDSIGDMRWMQIAIRPAKPFAFGLVGEGHTPVFGLPGNPVSSLVSFELFARPALRQMMGHAAIDRPSVSAVAGRRPAGAVPTARPTSCGSPAVSKPTAGITSPRSGAQGIHQLAATASADALAVVPDGDGVAEGGDVTAMLLDLIWPHSLSLVRPDPVDHVDPVVDLVDPYGRTVRDLRISVTDRCNFRCTYCMPEEGMQWLPRERAADLRGDRADRPGLRGALRRRRHPAHRWRADGARTPARFSSASSPRSTSTCR